MQSTELARLRRVAGKQTTRLTHYGRKTGKPYEVTIWFVLDGDALYIGTANAKRQWVRNVQKTPKIKLSIGNEIFQGNARFLTVRAEHERAMAAIRRKYWMFRPVIALGKVLTAIGLMRDNTGSFEVICGKRPTSWRRRSGSFLRVGRGQLRLDQRSWVRDRFARRRVLCGYPPLRTEVGDHCGRGDLTAVVKGNIQSG